MTERRTYTIEEAAQLCGIGRATAYAAARSGDLPTVRLGRRLVVPRAALAKLLGEDLPANDNGARHKEVSPSPGAAP
jgi:excisionase family DNA binding protein